MLVGVKTTYTVERLRSAICRAYLKSSINCRVAPLLVALRPSPFIAGSVILVSTAMIPTTTSNSSSVNAPRPARRAWPVVVELHRLVRESFISLPLLGRSYCQLRILSLLTPWFAFSLALADPSGPRDQTSTGELAR